MIQIKTPQQWFDEYVDSSKLQLKVIESMVQAIRDGNLEDDTYVAHVHDIVSGANGHYIPFLALEYFGYELNTNNVEQYDYESTIWELEKFADELADIINKELNNDISVSFGHWDSDGAYCLMAYCDKNEFENSKREAFSFAGEIWEMIDSN